MLQALKRSPVSTTIKEHSPGLAPGGKSEQRETTKCGYASRRSSLFSEGMGDLNLMIYLFNEDSKHGWFDSDTF